MKERIIGGAGLTAGTKAVSGMFGFESIPDFLHSMMGVQYLKINTIAAILAALTSAIGHYIWDSSEAVYTLWGLMFADWLTGILNALKLRKFQIHKILRMPIYFVATSALLAISWNLSKSTVYFIWLPGIVYGGFCSVYFLSLIDNLSDLGFMPKELAAIIKSRSKLKSLIKKDDESKT